MLLAASLAASVSCTTGEGGPGDSLGGALCGGAFVVETGAVGDFGATAAAQKVEAFLRATADVYDTSLAVEADVRGACDAMAADMGIPAANLQPEADELAVTASCRAVAEHVETELSAVLPADQVLVILVTPAECDVELDVAADCGGQCDVTIDGQAEIACDGTLHGTCSGRCTGRCEVDADIDCAGTCVGSCTGSCTGTCLGQCDGACSLVDGEGRCIGTCDGVCTGSCTGNCTGSCAGTCSVDIDGACQGECYGRCDLEWEPLCRGTADLDADIECQAACETQAHARVECSEPRFEVYIVPIEDSDGAARAARVAQALIDHYPRLVRAQYEVQTALVPSLTRFVEASDEVASVALDAGAQAVACMSVAVEAAVAAAASIEATVVISVDVSLSIETAGNENNVSGEPPEAW